jgi:hypothetical protein
VGLLKSAEDDEESHERREEDGRGYRKEKTE